MKKNVVFAAALLFPLLIIEGCGKKSEPAAVAQPVNLAALAAAVPNAGPRTENNYKVFFLALRQNQQPAVGFKVDASVKGKGDVVTKTTDAAGLVTFDSLPFPDATHQLVAVLHYYRGKNDDAREIDYPYIDSDAYRLKDTQYIPNAATPDAQ